MTTTINEKYFDTPLIPQQTKHWCSAASVNMLMESTTFNNTSKGKNQSYWASQLYFYKKNKTVDCSKHHKCRKTNFDPKLNKLGFSGKTSRTISWDNMIKQDKPVLYMKDEEHVMVINGFHENKNSKLLFVNDPLSVPFDSKKAYYIIIPYENYCMLAASSFYKGHACYYLTYEKGSDSGTFEKDYTHHSPTNQISEFSSGSLDDTAQHWFDLFKVGYLITEKNFNFYGFSSFQEAENSQLIFEKDKKLLNVKNLRAKLFLSSYETFRSLYGISLDNSDKIIRSLTKYDTVSYTIKTRQRKICDAVFFKQNGKWQLFYFANSVDNN